MGNASSSSATQQTLAVWMLARDGDSTALAAVMEQLPPELKASYLDWVDQADQRTPVAMATLLGHIDCLKLLLEAGADGNRVGRDGMGPLHLAVKADNQEITRLLLMSAQVDCNVVDARGYTPLLAAAADGRAKALDVLLQYDRVDVFACQEKSGLDVIGIANKAFKRASAIDRDTLKSALELVEKRLLVRAGYLFEYCNTSVLPDSQMLSKYFDLKDTKSWSWERRNYQVFRTADPESARILFYHIGSETPSMEFTLKDVRKSAGAYRYPASFRERGRTFTLRGIPTKKHSTAQIFECAASTIADMEFWRNLPGSLQTSNRPEPGNRTISDQEITAYQPHPEPLHQDTRESQSQEASLDERRHHPERSEHTQPQQGSDQGTLAPTKILTECEAPPHPSASRFDDTSVEEQPSAAQPPVSNQSIDCIICFDAAQSVACVPCGHIAMCMDCAQQVQSTTRVCPVCRASVQDIMKIFHA